MDPIWDGLGEATQPIQEYVTEFSWGEIFSRPGLNQQTRILLNLAMLVVQGESRVLSLHIRTALNLGCSRTEVREALIQTCTFAGFAKSTQACKSAQDIFDELMPQWCRIELGRQKQVVRRGQNSRKTKKQ